VVDGHEQSNRASPVIGGLLGHDQRPPAELYAAGRRELSSYPSLEYRSGQVRRGRRCDSGFLLDVDDGEVIRARRVLLATGMLYCPPEIPGLPELWGTSVFQCPFCHGWEMRDKRLAVLAAGDAAVHESGRRHSQRAVVLTVDPGAEVLAGMLDRGAQPFGVLLPGPLEAHSAGTHRNHAQYRQPAARCEGREVQQAQLFPKGPEGLDAFVVVDEIAAAVKDQPPAIQLDRSRMV
jgi:hypothetical protein